MSEKPIRLVRCPRCRKSVRYDETNEFRPFCSALCKNEDIVDWAEGSYGIPVEEEDGAETPLHPAHEED